MTRRTLAFAAAVVLALPVCAGANDAPRPVVLDVPYVPQSGELCGGAAAAMVMRYWGARSIDAEAFASLVDPAMRGIPIGALAAALVSRGWHSYALGGSRDLVRHHLDAGRPVIALISVAPNRRHYVVIVSWSTSHVVFHDPAQTAFRSMTVSAFDRVWNGSRRWMLLVLPPEGGVSRPVRADAAAPIPAACRAQVARGVAFAGAREFNAAAAELRAARAACPSSAAPVTELAGVWLLQSNFSAAEGAALEATVLDPGDRHAWRTLAASRYVLHEREAALDAWNRAGDPVLDLVQVDGLSRTRESTIAHALGIGPGRVLTSEALELGRRRVEEIPAIAAAQLEYVPTGGGQADLRASVVESSLVPSSRLELGALAVGAAVNRELAWTLASPTHNGETFSAEWRWWQNRPRMAVSAAVPLGGALPGVLTLTGAAERESFARISPVLFAPALVLDRQSASVGFSSWATSWFRWHASAGIDRWRDIGAFGTIGGGADMRAARDHVAVELAGALWPGQSGFGALSAGARWRSTTEPTDAVLTLVIDGALAGEQAPRDLWPGADTGHARSLLLRAHPLLDDGIVSGEAYGRRVAHATGEWESRSLSRLLVRVRGALFVDAARAWRGDATRDRTLVDVGTGVRLGVAGQSAIRVDVAHGITDGANAFSIGWVVGWPGPSAKWEQKN